MSARAIASALVASSSRVASARRASGRWTSRGGARRGVAVPAPRAAAPSDGSEDVDDPSDLAASSNPLFTPEFVRAFTEAQDRIQERAAPDRERISEEVAQILERVGTERDLEELLPEEEPASPEDIARVEAEEQKRLSEVEEEFVSTGALDNPLFNEQFKRTFLEAQARIKEKEAPMRAKINAEVEEIMRRVNAEREAAARGETLGGGGVERGDENSPAAADDAAADSDSRNSSVREVDSNPIPAPDPRGYYPSSTLPAPASPPQQTGAPAAAHPDDLREMRRCSEAQVAQLRAALAGVERALRAETTQLRRIDLAIEKAAREARYAEAEKVARERREQREREEREAAEERTRGEEEEEEEEEAAAGDDA